MHRPVISMVGCLKGMTISGMEFSVERNDKSIRYVLPVHLSRTDADMYRYMSILTNGSITCKSEFIDKRWISAAAESNMRGLHASGDMSALEVFNEVFSGLSLSDERR